MRDLGNSLGRGWRVARGIRSGSRTAATSKMEHFVITLITKGSILDVAAVLDPPLGI